jgi:hypothetical protein
VIRQVIPEPDRGAILDNIDVPQAVNLGVTDSSTISSADGQILREPAGRPPRGTASDVLTEGLRVLRPSLKT